MGLGIGGCSLSPPFSLTEKQFKAQRRGDSSLSPETAFKSTLHMLLLQLSASHQHGYPPVPARKPSTHAPRCKTALPNSCGTGRGVLADGPLGRTLSMCTLKKKQLQRGKKGKIISHTVLDYSTTERNFGGLRRGLGRKMHVIHQQSLTAPRWSLYWPGFKGMSARFAVNIRV